MLKKIATSLFGTRHAREMRRVQPIVDAINAEYERLHSVSEEELRACLDAALGLDGSEAKLPPAGAGPANAVAMFEQLVDELVSHTNGSHGGVARSAPFSRRRA